MLNVVLINNYDSFTYNIVSLISNVILNKNKKVNVNTNKTKIYDNNICLDIYYNDSIYVNSINYYDIIVISSGPYSPRNSGMSYKIVEKFLSKKPILGICLGHQIIGSVLGFSIRQSSHIIHGDTTFITHLNFPFWFGIPKRIKVARYNSLTIYCRNKTIQNYVSSISDDREIMSIESAQEKFLGVQFHPDSFLSSKYSHKLIENFFHSMISTF